MVASWQSRGSQLKRTTAEVPTTAVRVMVFPAAWVRDTSYRRRVVSSAMVWDCTEVCVAVCRSSSVSGPTVSTSMNLEGSRPICPAGQEQSAAASEPGAEAVLGAGQSVQAPGPMSGLYLP